ncbi:MAG TPA: hypothetical protein VJW94_09975 [Candidatus Acidoferrum sp.]|nr:hypothetical protein [Candidatus Acidoferrum sp.]
MLKFEPREVSWVQFFHDQAVDSREYVKKVADQIPVEIRDALLSIVQWAEEMEKSCDMWCDIVFKQMEEEIHLNMLLEEEMKTLFAAIRATKRQDAIRALRETARDSGNRIRAWKFEAEQKRLQAEGFMIARPSPPAVPHVRE